MMVALGGYRRYRALLLALDRMEITTPRVYSRAVEAARRLDELSGRDRKHAHHRLSGGARDPRTRARDARHRRARRRADGARAGRRRRKPATGRCRPSRNGWSRACSTRCRRSCNPINGRAATAYESRLLQALAGPPPGTNAPTLKWEGLDYRVDYFASEHAPHQAHSRATDLAGPGRGARRQQRRAGCRSVTRPDLLAGPRRSRRPRAARRRHRPAPRLRSRRRRRVAPRHAGVEHAARTGRRRQSRGTSRARCSASTSRSRVSRCAA